MGEVDGKFTGRLDELPPIGEARALVLAEYAEAEGLRLEESMAYADSASDLPMLEAVGFPVAVNPEAKLAAIAGGAVGTSSTGTRPTADRRPACPSAPSIGEARDGVVVAVRPLRPERSGGWPARPETNGEGPGARTQRGPVCGLPGLLPAGIRPGRGHRTTPTARRRAPRRPVRRVVPLRPLLSGICGSDLATLDGRSSRYFEDMVSFPFVPGHEVVGVLDEGGTDHAGRRMEPGARAVIEPVLGCVPRGIRPPCPRCAEGHTGLCGNVAFGDLEPGLQTGFCADTGGGWSQAGLVAHASQLHAVPESLSDEDAVNDRAHRLRRPCRPVRGHRRRGHRGPWSGPAPWDWPWWPPWITWSDR